MAESCLPCSCSSCGCSTQYHFVHPSLATFNKPPCITLGAQKAASCQGNRHPRRHPMTAQGEGGGTGGRVGDAALALSVLQGVTDLWPFHSTPPRHWHTRAKCTKQQCIFTHRETHMRAHKQEKKRKERDRRGFQSLRFRVIIWISVRVINWSNLCAISSDSMYGSWFHYTVTLITFRAS